MESDCCGHLRAHVALLKEKASQEGYSPALVRSPIERYLEENHEAYDLVAFQLGSAPLILLCIHRRAHH